MAALTVARILMPRPGLFLALLLGEGVADPALERDLVGNVGRPMSGDVEKIADQDGRFVLGHRFGGSLGGRCATPPNDVPGWLAWLSPSRWMTLLGRSVVIRFRGVSVKRGEQKKESPQTESLFSPPSSHTSSHELQRAFHHIVGGAGPGNCAARCRGAVASRRNPTAVCLPCT